MKKLFVPILFTLTGYCTYAQNIGINTTTPDSSAAMEVYAADKGFLMPRLTTTQMNAISKPATGLAVFNTDSSGICVYTGTAWVKQIVSTDFTNYFTASGNNIYSNNSGNVGIGTSSPAYKLQVSGTAAADSINTSYLKITNGAANGYVLQSDSNGNGSWASQSGVGAIRYISSTQSFVGQTSGYGSTGTKAGSGSGAYNNIFIGDKVGNQNVSGNYNAVIGNRSFTTNTSGEFNTAIGHQVMLTNTTGSYNVANGSGALYYNTTGSYNVANGFGALYYNNYGSNNTAIGNASNQRNTSGSQNVTIGANSGYSCTTGDNNTYIGSNSGYSNQTGSSNVFLGYNSGYSEKGSNKLYISNSNTSTPLIYGDFSTNKVTINESLESKYFKMTNGASNGYVLQSDASGNASWVSSTTLSNSNWTTNGSNQYSAVSGNVGIGITSPSYKLQVSGTAAADTINASYLYGTKLKLTNGASNGYVLQSDASGNASWGALSGSSIITAGTGLSYDGSTLNSVWTNTGNDIYSNTSGNVGIGTTSPTSTLHISGSESHKVTAVSTSNNSTILGSSDYCLIYSDGTDNSITLPSAGSYAGREYLIVNHSSSDITIDTYYTAYNTPSTSVSAGSTVQLMSDGTNWHKIN